VGVCGVRSLAVEPQINAIRLLLSLADNNWIQSKSITQRVWPPLERTPSFGAQSGRQRLRKVGSRK